MWASSLTILLPLENVSVKEYDQEFQNQLHSRVCKAVKPSCHSQYQRQRTESSRPVCKWGLLWHSLSCPMTSKLLFDKKQSERSGSAWLTGLLYKLAMTFISKYLFGSRKCSLRSLANKQTFCVWQGEYLMIIWLSEDEVLEILKLGLQIMSFLNRTSDEDNDENDEDANGDVNEHHQILADIDLEWLTQNE